MVVATVGVGSVDKFGFHGQRRVGGPRLCNYSHLEPSIHWHFGSPLLLCLLWYWGLSWWRILSDKICWCTVGVGHQAYPLVLNRSSFFLLGMDRDKGCRIWPGWSGLSWMCGCFSSSWFLLQCPQFLLAVGTWSTHALSCILVWEYRPSGKLALLSFIVSIMLFHTVSCVPEAKVNHVIPCLSIIWKSKGSFFCCVTQFSFVAE